MNILTNEQIEDAKRELTRARWTPILASDTAGRERMRRIIRSLELIIGEAA